MIAYTTFTADGDQLLTKRFGLDASGSLTKTTIASMATGRAERTEVRDLAELADRLDALNAHQAVGWGVATVPSVRIVTADADNGRDPARISRTRSNFAFAKAPGGMMLDHDGAPDGPLDADTLRAKLIEACPVLEDASMLVRPSVSSGLLGSDGRELTPLGRWRTYLAAVDASLIPQAGARLVTLLQAAGMSWCEVGAAGQVLQRCLVDASVWQPERLDFAARPIVADGIRRRDDAHGIVGDPTALFDLARIVVTPAQEKAAAARRKDSREAVREACRAKREEWATARAPALAEARKISVDKARDVLVRACEHAKLTGDFLVTMQDGSRVSVGEILDNPSRWHNTRCADPLDPDDDRRVGVINLRSGGRPFIYSHRHGGVRFELLRQCARVRIGRGMRIDATDATLQVLLDRGELFEHSDSSIAYVANGRLRPVTLDFLLDHMGRACEFYSVHSRQAPDGSIASVDVPEDAPMAVARAILAKHGERGFRPLTAVINTPILRADGSALDEPGYDDASGLLYYSADPNPPRVPLHPTPDDALEALRLLWAPFSLFPFVNDVARGVMLHALLTAVLRPSLATAPGVAYDAPGPGTGKTLLGSSVGALATGTAPAVLTLPDTEEETEKRLLALLREGHRVIFIDNIREPVADAKLDAFLTAKTFGGRVLGASTMLEFENRALVVLSGNNIRLVGDTCRRIPVARLDAKIERPYAREFDFDPVQRIQADRSRFIIAALTIVRAYITAGRPRGAPGRTASFEQWDDLVRQPIVWLAGLLRERDDPTLPMFADPLEAVADAFEGDPETTKHCALLATWHAAFAGRPTKIADAIRFGAGDPEGELAAALDEIAGQGGRVNPRILGRWIERMVGRRIDGKWFVREGLSAGTMRWSVQDEKALRLISKPAGRNDPTKSHQEHQTAASKGAGVVGVVRAGGSSSVGRINSPAAGDDFEVVQ